MAHNIREDIKNKQIASNIITSEIYYNHVSRPSMYNVKKEAVDYGENPCETEESNVEKDRHYAEDLTDEDELYWDNNIADILQVECNEDISNAMEMCGETSTNHKVKVYQIENKCAICEKKFSCQRDLTKHAQQIHPSEKAFKCQYCPALFSKLKSVTAHFKRSHTELKSQFHSSPENRAQIWQVEKHASIGNMNETNDGNFLNRKAKIYPVENKCAVCEKQYPFQRDLVKHTQQAHPDAKVFKCLYCTTLFSKLKSVTTHYKRSHSKLRKTIICEYCNMAFFTQFLLDRHRRAHTEHRPFACNECDKTYKYKRNLLVHMRTHSKDFKGLNTNVEDHYMDEYCNNDDQFLLGGDDYCNNDEENLLTEDEYCEIREQNLLTEHEGVTNSEIASTAVNLSNFTEQYPFKCNECEKAYKHKKNLKIHQKTHWKNNEITETIILDDTSANEEDNINFHNSTYFIIDELNTDSEHFAEDEFTTGNYSYEYDYEDYNPVNNQISANIEQNECGICMKVFKCKQYVTKHLQRCHAEIDFFRCPYCDDNFYSLDALSLHIKMKKHLQKRHVCEKCLRSFDRKSDLRRHMKIHNDERPYSCNICNKHFKQNNHLKRHKELNHDISNAPLKYSCDIAPTSFLLKETPKRGITLHERETHFPCSMCDKVFKTRYDWQRHEETHNSSRKNLICEYCVKSFDDIQTLNIHLKVHTGERKYLCTICDRTYKEKSHLVNHRKSHTNC